MRTTLVAVLLLELTVSTEAAKRKVSVDSGPDLPYSCTMVRWAAALYTPAQLEEMGRANGISLSPKQRRQAKACIIGK